MPGNDAPGHAWPELPPPLGTPAGAPTVLPATAPPHMALPAPELTLAPIQLREPADPAQRPRVVIADDAETVLAALHASAAVYPHTLDLRFWQAGRDPDLEAYLDNAAATGWRAQVLVLDINLAVGGVTSLEYLARLRAAAHWRDLAVVLATGGPALDLMTDQIRGPRQQGAPSGWLPGARAHAPEAVLYRKTGEARFLGRIGELIPEWRTTARRRVWQTLQDELAHDLSGPVASADQAIALCGKLARQLRQALPLGSVVIRQRHAQGFRLLACDSDDLQLPTGHELATHQPLLSQLETAQEGYLHSSQLPVAWVGTDPALQRLCGQQMLGTVARLDGEAWGTITVYARAGTPAFEPALEGPPLGVLGSMLAAALGRSRLLAQMKQRQQQLLAFSRKVGEGQSAGQVRQALVDLLHNVLHDGDNTQAKTLMALIDPGKTTLERREGAGLKPTGDPVSVLDTRGSACARAIEQREPWHIPDVRALGRDEPYRETTQGTRSELCLPLRVGDGALGVLNLEHQQPNRYADEPDRDFAAVATQITAQVLAKIKRQAFVSQTLAFVEGYDQLSAAQVQTGLRELLYEFTGYSALVVLEPRPGEALTSPWQRVGEADLRLHNANVEPLDRQLGPGWEQTWLYRLCAEQDWRLQRARITSTPGEFAPLPLLTHRGTPTTNRASGVLWLCDASGQPLQALLMLWLLPPPLESEDLNALARLADLFAAARARREQLSSLREQALAHAVRATLGDAMQHFRHRLVAQTGALNGAVELLQLAVERQQWTQVADTLPLLANTVRRLDAAYPRSLAYAKVPLPRACTLEAVVTPALVELEARLSAAQVAVRHHSLPIYTDPDVADLIVFSLLENALDVLRDVPLARLELSARSETDARGGTWTLLRVQDNGPGLPAAPEARQRLMTLGFSTKKDGLGASLALARQRAELMGGALAPADPQPPSGAAFEWRLPADEDTYRATVCHLPGSSP